MLHPGLRRSDAIAKKQVDASNIILKAYIDDALKDGDWREAKECFRTLFRYLRSDEYVKNAYRDLAMDPLDVIKAFLNDSRIETRYRTIQLQGMIAKIEQKRARRAKLSKHNPLHSFVVQMEAERET